MGIQGLLPTLKSVMNPAHIRDYAGKRAAVDTYSWLHKAAFSCSKDICEGRPNEKFIDYCLHRINLLRHHGVQPVLVFDGACLPMKFDEELKRARSRKENLERALEHERVGNKTAAFECYQKAVDITPAIAFRLITVLRQMNVEYVVAPYEADAQLAFFGLHGHVDLVITEDSDLIAYGCPKVFFKMDKYGQGVEFQFCNIMRNKGLDFNNFTRQMVLEMCIMSGCDYLPSLPGMGVKRAHGLIKRFKNYPKVIKHLKFSGVFIDEEYVKGFERAILTFRHQRVYDPTKAEMVHLTDVSSELSSDLEFLGPHLSQTLVTAIARGDVDPTTNEPFEDKSGPGRPDSQEKMDTREQKVEVEAPRNVLTNYFHAPLEGAKKHFRTPRIHCNNSSSTSYASQGEVAYQARQSILSPFNKFTLTSLKSPIFRTPPMNPFVEDELQLNGKETGIIDLESEIRRPLKRVYETAGELQNNENISPTVAEPKVANLEFKTRKIFVSPLLQTAAVGYGSQSEANSKSVPVKRSGYFSRPAPFQLDAAIPASKDMDVLADYQEHDADTQNSGRICFADQGLEDPDDAAGCPPAENEQEVARTTLRKGGQSSDAIAAGKRKHIPYFRSNLLGENPRSESFTSVSHVGQYASLAQTSMDQFVSTIAPFRCSKIGTRASGLRAPSKSARNKVASKSQAAESSKKTTDPLNQFAHTSPLTIPRPAALASPIAAGTVRWQTYSVADWE